MSKVILAEQSGGTTTLAANMALVSDSSGNVATSSNVTSTELGYLDGATSNVQTQINNKLSLSGGTMTGNLILNADPTVALQAATKQYVDNCITESNTFDWGDQTATGDLDWWANLKGWVKYHSTAAQREACVGKTKSVTLTSAVKNCTTHLVRCIGYDCDGDRTLTFQSEYGLYDTTTAANNYFCTSSQYSTFGSQALWYDGTNNSQAREQCIAYYNAFPGKASIKTVTKKYNTVQANSYYTTACDKSYSETVFLPSENEMGFNSSVCYGSAKDEFCTENTSYTPYQYYSEASKRIKYRMDNGVVTTTACYYWERTRRGYSSYPNYVCCVYTNGGAGHYNYSSTPVALAPAYVIG